MDLLYFQMCIEIFIFFEMFVCNCTPCAVNKNKRTTQSPVFSPALSDISISVYYYSIRSPQSVPVYQILPFHLSISTCTYLSNWMTLRKLFHIYHGHIKNIWNAEGWVGDADFDLLKRSRSSRADRTVAELEAIV